MTQTILLLIIVALLCAVLTMLLMQPRRKMNAGTLTLDIECDAKPALAQIGELTAAVERLDAAQRKAGLNLQVLDTPPAMHPAMTAPVDAGSMVADSRNVLHADYRLRGSRKPAAPTSSPAPANVAKVKAKRRK